MTTDALHGCIYCCRSLPSRVFTQEHVLSRAFGTFKDALTLQNVVCGDCNQFFGDHLETRVARGAFEGLLRYQRGAKAPNREGLKLRYVEFTIPQGSAWAGVRLNLAWRNGKVVVDLISQVALFDRSTSDWVHFSDADIGRRDIQNNDTGHEDGSHLRALG